MRNLWIAIKVTIVFTVLTGIVYPAAVYSLAHLIFPWQANGSLIVRNGTVVGSELIGQNFTSPRYFHGRPSAAGDKGYDATASGGSNLGPTNKALIDAARTRLKDILAQNPGSQASQVPIDLVTASASGLDPDISIDAAELQVARLAAARGLSEDQLQDLIRTHARGRFAGLFGEPRVNVLMLNLALDDLKPPNRK
ncbi:MAG TPA: potassium-transporting ATPase subunit KdpC [Candidatus Binataceae bacterium]